MSISIIAGAPTHPAVHSVFVHAVCIRFAVLAEPRSIELLHSMLPWHSYL